MSPKRDDTPPSLRSLEKRIDNLAKQLGRPMRRIQRAVANTAVGQMLPPGVVKGGTALKLRVGEAGSRVNFVVGLGDKRERAQASHEAGARYEDRRESL